MTIKNIIKSGIFIIILFLLFLWNLYNMYNDSYNTNRVSQIRLFYLPLNSSELFDKENYYNINTTSKLINNIYGYNDFIIYTNATHDKIYLAFLAKLTANNIVLNYLDTDILQVCNNVKDDYLIYIIDNKKLNIILKCYKSNKYQNVKQLYFLIVEKIKNTKWFWNNSVTRLLQYDKISGKVLKAKYL